MMADTDAMTAGALECRCISMRNFLPHRVTPTLATPLFDSRYIVSQAYTCEELVSYRCSLRGGVAASVTSLAGALAGLCSALWRVTHSL